MEETDSIAKQASEQAAQWWVELRSETCSDTQRRAFAQWVARSPERITAYLRMATAMSALEEKPVRWPQMSTESLIREARQNLPVSILTGGRGSAHYEEDGYSDGLTGVASNNVATASRVQALGRSESGRAAWFKFRSWQRAAFAGIAAAVLLSLGFFWFAAQPDHYQTAIGEQRSIVLPDDSIVVLNTNSRVVVDFNSQRRELMLHRGEALFQVAHDSRRPFTVVAGNTRIRALGTQFNVRRSARDTTVTVVEGVVEVAGASQASAKQRLAASQRVVSHDDRVGAPETLANAGRVTAWTQRLLIFERQPLGDVVAEFNRYNREQLQLQDSELSRRQVTGVFQANDAHSFVQFLSQIPGVEVRSSADGARRIVSRRVTGISGAEQPDPITDETTTNPMLPGPN